MMRYELAPLEGVTGTIFRRTFHECFTPFDRCYTPFLTPTQDRLITARMWSEIDPVQNEGMHLVPQLLCNQAELFLWAAEELQKLGYGEINLNLGCPSGTVVKKKKGSGLLGEVEWLEQMLDEIFSRCPISVSLKTRVGLKSEEELSRLLEIYNRYPIASLIVHPRIQADQYKGAIRWNAFAKVMQNALAPVCYNGDLFRPEDVEKMQSTYPQLPAVMLGRGGIANPGLIGYLKTGKWAELSQVQQFHALLLSRYQAAMPGRTPTLFKMQEVWTFLACMFDCPEKALKRLRHARTIPEFDEAANHIFHTCPYLPDASYRKL